MKSFIKIGFGKTKKIKIQICATVFPFTNWICFGDQMSFVAITKDHPVNSKLSFPINSTFGTYLRHLLYCCAVSISYRLAACDRKIKSFKKFSEFGVNT